MKTGTGLFRAVQVLLLAAVLIVGVSATASAQGLNLDQCQNGTLTNLGTDCGTATPPSWENGNINGQNSQYREGDGVPYRLAITGLSNGTWSVMVDYDFTQGGKFALDRLTRFNLTQASDPCSDSPDVACTKAASEFTFTMPGEVQTPSATQPALPNSGNLDIAGTPNKLNDVANSRVMTVWVEGGTGSFTAGDAGSNCTGTQATSLNNGFVVQSGLASGNSNRAFGFKFTLTNCTGTSCNVMLGWTGHIASSETGANGGWETGNGASFITGAPFHMRVEGVDQECGTSGGNQDRSVQLSAITTDDPPDRAFLTVIKIVEGDPAVAPSAFTMTINDIPDSELQNPPNFFPGDAQGVEKIVIGGFPNNSYNVTESDVANCTATSFSTDCSGTIDVDESKTCTVINTCVPPPRPQPVDTPTLSEWGMIGMALILAAVAVWYLRRRPMPGA